MKTNIAHPNIIDKLSIDCYYVQIYIELNNENTSLK